MRVSKQNYFRYLHFLKSSNIIRLNDEDSTSAFGMFFYNFINDKIYNLWCRVEKGNLIYFVRVYKKV